MSGRFFYHGFWNCYDYLGRLALFGIVYGLAVAFGVFAAVYITMAFGTFPDILLNTLPWLSTFLVSIFCFPGVFYFCHVAARGDSARFADVRTGFRQCFFAVTMVLVLWGIGAAILAINFRFYYQLHLLAQTDERKLLFAILSMLTLWFIFLWITFLTPWLCAVTTEAPVKKRAAIRRALTLFVLAPAPWVIITLLLVVILLLFRQFPPVCLLVLPLIASLGQTAHRLILQYIGFLDQARHLLGDGQPYRAYKTKALQLARDWDEAQPRRTFRELIKPWEH